MEKIQTEDGLRLHLKEQTQFLINSAMAYDKGFKDEAKRMAVTIRLLVHDTSRSNSLLGLLKIKDILFCDTAVDYDPQNIAPHNALTAMQINANGWKYIPLLDKRKHRKILFDKWWNKIVIVDSRRNEFTRKDLILAVANQDGGAHVDQALDEKYYILSRLHTGGWKVSTNNGEENLKDIHLASIRQITYEVLETLKDNFPDLINKE